jgi:hypothetical protein
MARDPWPATERASTLQAVIVKAMGERHWLHAAAILRGSARTLCRWTPGSEHSGHDERFDGRMRRPGPRHGPVPMVAQGVWRDREQSGDVHVRHGQERRREA